MKKLLFSVTMKDLEMQTFTVGGRGGGGKDTSNSGVRLIHHASGAVGEGKNHRSNSLNRQDAFLRLVNSEKFKNWHKIECAKCLGQKIPLTESEIKEQVELAVEKQLNAKNIKIEYYTPEEK